MRQRLLPLLVLAACGDGGDSASAIPDVCNPLGGQGCLLPWPSMAYVTADGGTATGYRLDLPREGMPVNREGVAIEPAFFNRWDGFSAIGPMLAIFPEGVSADGLPTHRDPAASLAAASPIVLLDLDTGERAPFFAEIDQNVRAPGKGALIIRPLMRLRTGGHYAVAIRSTVRAEDGGPLASPPGFLALRDGDDFDHPRFGAASANAEAMFDALATAGVERNELVLAWDFVTASDQFLRSDLETMRAAALPAIGPAGANLSFTTVTKPNTMRTFRRYTGTFKSPAFLTEGTADASVMRRDERGLPVRSGMYDARFAAIVPACVQTQPLPRPVIVFGHGLFGSAEGYLDDDFVENLAEQHCFIIVAGDFIGLTQDQLGGAAVVVTDFNHGPRISDKLSQAIIDFIALESAVRGPMAQSDAFKLDKGAGPEAVIDPSRVYYVGGSLGGIMGNTFMAYDPNITRGVLAVPGGNWSMLLERSTAWQILLSIHQGSYRDPDVQQLNLALAFGMGLEPVDPMTTAAHVLKDPLFGNPVKNILIWYALGDSLVTNISTEMIAREMDIPLLGPTVKTPWGMTAATGPLPNGLVVYDQKKTPLPFETNQPQSDNGTHSGVNKLPAPMRQVQQFLLGSQVASQECRIGGAPAPCDCTTGACN